MNNLVHGALHVNCPFAEPLYGDDIEHDTPWTQALGKWWQSDKPWLQETLSPSVTTHTLNGIDYVRKEGSLLLDVSVRKRGLPLPNGPHNWDGLC